ncbi:MAG: hypothetical protein EB060_06975 [Proteobacteria bacterium]|nr:hypothetical protein [Pseudomonadota bacterium]
MEIPAVVRSALFFAVVFAALPAYAVDPAARAAFDAPVTSWKTMTPEQKTSTIQLLDYTKALDAEKTTKMQACMDMLAGGGTFDGMDVGLINVKCAHDLGFVKSPSEERQKQLIACVQKEIPDFSEKEFLAVSLSAVAVGLSKDGQQPVATPRTQQILEAMKRCNAGNAQ